MTPSSSRFLQVNHSIYIYSSNFSAIEKADQSVIPWILLFSSLFKDGHSCQLFSSLPGTHIIQEFEKVIAIGSKMSPARSCSKLRLFPRRPNWLEFSYINPEFSDVLAADHKRCFSFFMYISFSSPVVIGLVHMMMEAK